MLIIELCQIDRPQFKNLNSRSLIPYEFLIYAAQGIYIFHPAWAGAWYALFLHGMHDQELVKMHLSSLRIIFLDIEKFVDQKLFDIYYTEYLFFLEDFQKLQTIIGQFVWKGEQ